MNVWLCDVCGDRVDEIFNETKEEEKWLKNYPNGYFTLDFRQMVLGPDKKPSHFSYRDFHMCDRCRARINKSIFETIAKIQESTYHPTAVIGIDKFPPEPKVMPQTMYAGDMPEGT